jgi:RimJ/RimL family protein N-acetyltransferase
MLENGENRMTFTSYESSMMPMITIRPAVENDSQDLFTWRNDPDSRQASISQAVVSREDHERWFASSLASPRRAIYLAIDSQSGESIGMCRFDLDESATVAEVSINLNPKWRGRGLALSVLTEAIKSFRLSAGKAVPLTATVRSTNPASARIFVNAGFLLTATDGGLDHYRAGGEQAS